MKYTNASEFVIICMYLFFLFWASMSSTNTEVSEQFLVNLIYQHLKENGHEKAANVLKKHAPQVEATSGEVSLNDIFKKWVIKNRKKTSGGHVLESKVSKPKAPRKAVRSTSSNSNDKSQKRKRSGKKDKLSSLAEAPTEAIPDLASISVTAGDDSDSDSSLDVEKWKRLALELSDADIGKMDTITNLCMFATSSRKKTTTNRKPAQTKKDSSRNMKAKKTKAKTLVSHSKTNKTGTPLKPNIEKNNRTFEKRKNAKAKIPETKPAEDLSEKNITPKKNMANGHSETDSIKTPTKKVKHKKPQSFSESSNIETSTQTAQSQKSDEHAEPGKVDASRKNAKSKKTIIFSEPLETPSRVSDSIVNSAQSKTCDLSDTKLVDTPSKKAKSKKTVKHTQHLNVTTPAEEVDDENACIHTPSKKSSLEPAETSSKKSKKSRKCSEQVDQETLSKETETEIANRLLTSDQLKTTKKSTKAVNSTQVKSPLVANICAQPETLSKKSKGKKARPLPEPGDVNSLSEEAQTHIVSTRLTPDRLQTPSKKATAKKTKSVVEPDPVDTPCKKAKGKQTDTSYEITGAETQKLEDHTSDALSKDIHSETPSKKGKKRKNKDDDDGKTSELDKGSTEPKKKKKDKEKKMKETEDSLAEVLPPSDEFADNLASSPNKKHKKKKKCSDVEKTLESSS